MKPRCGTNWKSRGWNRRSLFLLGIVAAMTTGGPALSEDETPVVSEAERQEMEREIAEEIALIDERMGEPAPKSGEPITCGNNYCSGKYEDLISYRFEAYNGYSALRVSTEMEAFLAASSFNCSATTYLVIRGSSDSSTSKNAMHSRWLAELMMAEMLGNKIQINWYSPTSTCWVDRIYTWTLNDPNAS